MDTDEPITGGATGEPAEPVADGSQVDLDDIVKTVSAAPTEPTPKPLDENLLKQLESIDPRELPEKIRTKLEAPFLSLRSKQTTEWDAERKRYLDTIDRLANRPADAPPPTDDRRQLLAQKFQDGDYEGAQQLIDEMMNAKVAPQFALLNRENSARHAASLEPSIKENELVVAQTLTNNPPLARLINSVSSQDPNLGGVLLAGVARAVKADILEQKLQDMEKTFDSRVKAGIAEYQKRLKGLPPSTSQGGSRPSREVNEDEFDRNRIRDEAWTEAGGS